MAMSLHSSGASQPTKRVGGNTIRKSVKKTHTYTPFAVDKQNEKSNSFS